MVRTSVGTSMRPGLRIDSAARTWAAALARCGGVADGDSGVLIGIGVEVALVAGHAEQHALTCSKRQQRCQKHARPVGQLHAMPRWREVGERAVDDDAGGKVGWEAREPVERNHTAERHAEDAAALVGADGAAQPVAQVVDEAGDRGRDGRVVLGAEAGEVEGDGRGRIAARPADVRGEEGREAEPVALFTDETTQEEPTHTSLRSLQPAKGHGAFVAITEPSVAWIELDVRGRPRGSAALHSGTHGPFERVRINHRLEGAAPAAPGSANRLQSAAFGDCYGLDLRRVTYWRTPSSSVVNGVR